MTIRWKWPNWRKPINQILITATGLCSTTYFGDVMKHTTFAYEISTYVELTGDEIKRLCELSASHYDGLCRSASKVGGFLYGITNQYKWAQDEEPTGTVEVRLTWDQLDTLAKIAEGENRYALVGGTPIFGDLGRQIHEIMVAITAQRIRLNELVPSIYESITKAIPSI